MSQATCLAQAISKILPGAEVDYCRYPYLFLAVSIEMDAPVLPLIPVPSEDLDEDLLFQFWPISALVVQ